MKKHTDSLAYGRRFIGRQELLVHRDAEVVAGGVLLTR